MFLVYERGLKCPPELPVRQISKRTTMYSLSHEEQGYSHACISTWKEELRPVGCARRVTLRSKRNDRLYVIKFDTAITTGDVLLYGITEHE